MRISAEDGDVVMKAQVLAGGRGRGVFSNGYKGGVHLATRYIILGLHSIYQHDCLHSFLLLWDGGGHGNRNAT